MLSTFQLSKNILKSYAYSGCNCCNPKLLFPNQNYHYLRRIREMSWNILFYFCQCFCIVFLHAANIPKMWWTLGRWYYVLYAVLEMNSQCSSWRNCLYTSMTKQLLAALVLIAVLVCRVTHACLSCTPLKYAWTSKRGGALSIYIARTLIHDFSFNLPMM